MTIKDYRYYQELKKELAQCEDAAKVNALMHNIHTFEVRHNISPTQIPYITK